MLGCSLHGYYGPSQLATRGPAIGCKMCMITFILHDLAKVPPSERLQRLEEFEEVVRNLNQAVETGKFDYQPLEHPEIHIDKDAWPDA